MNLTKLIGDTEKPGPRTYRTPQIDDDNDPLTWLPQRRAQRHPGTCHLTAWCRQHRIRSISTGLQTVPRVKAWTWCHSSGLGEGAHPAPACPGRESYLTIGTASVPSLSLPSGRPSRSPRIITVCAMCELKS